MEIKLNTNIDFVARVSHSRPKGTGAIDSGSTTQPFEDSHSLESRLSSVPDVRPEKVDDARRMAGDPAYPPRETIKRLAALLAMDQGDNSQQ
jgi:hypothetical protein